MPTAEASFLCLWKCRGALGKGGKNKVLHLEKLQFKCISTKGGCVLAYGALETSEGRAGLGIWGSPAEYQQPGCREVGSKTLGEGRAYAHRHWPNLGEGPLECLLHLLNPV